MSKSPRVSLGMPIYNGENFMEGVLESILGQSYSDFELVICDNASTDRTAEICRDYALKDARVNYHRNEKNLGAAKNYNLAFEMSSGELFKWVAHDDMLAPAYLEKCVAELDRRPEIVLCYPSTVMIDGAGNETGANPADMLDISAKSPHSRLNGFFHSSSKNRKCHAVFGLIRRKVLAKTGLIGAYARSDYILLAELSMHGLFSQIDDKLFYRREHPKSSVNANPGLKERNAWFDPANKNDGKLQTFFWFLEYLRAINRVEMNLLEKCRCYIEMQVWLRKNRRSMNKDIALFMRKLF